MGALRHRSYDSRYRTLPVIILGYIRFSPMTPQSSPTHSSTMEEQENDIFSLGSILHVLRRHWPSIFLCALLGAAAAYYYAAKQGYVYEKKASILMRNEQKREEGTSERILKELGAESGTANLANESFVMRSTPVMLQVVKDLKLNISYWKKQDIRLLDIYKESPILIEFLEINPQKHCSLSITPLSEQNYKISFENTHGQNITIEGNFGTPQELPFATINVHPTTLLSLDQMDIPILVTRRPEMDTAKDLLGNFTVTRPDTKESSLLQLSLKSTNPQKTGDSLDKIISVYNSFSKDEITRSAQKTEKFIKELIEELEKDLKTADDKISKFMESSELVHDASSTLNANFSTLQQLEQSIFEIETQIKLARNLEGTLKNAEERKTLLSVDTGISDTSITKQLELYNESYLEYKKIAGSAGAQNPIVVSLKERMDATRTAINRSIKNYQTNLDLRLSELEKKKKDLDARMISTSAKGKNLEPMTRDYNIKSERYQVLLSKRDENALSLYIAEPSARVLEIPYGSDAPIAPKINQFIAIGAGGGGAFCLFILLLASLVDAKVRSKQDLQNISNVPIVGELPLLSEKERKERTFNDVGDRSIYSECFHILRNNVATFVPQQEETGQIILLTSTLPGEGKTQTAINLAASFAQTGKRVLLIDGDLRKVSLSKKLEGRSQKGLSNLLLNSKEIPDTYIRIHTENKNLHLLFAGPIPPNPVLLLTSPRLGELMQMLKERYDIIIIDAPPYGLLADTAIWAAHADITLYIIRSGKIDKRFFTNIQRLEEEGKVKNLAYVLNAVDFKRASYRQYGYGYGQYNYHYENGKNKPRAKVKN